MRTLARAEARAFVEAHHYSKNLPSGKNFYFGTTVDGTLVAVAVYGISASMGMEKALTKYFNEPVAATNYVELRRLCRVGGKDDSAGCPPLTWVLAKCHKLLVAEGIRFVVSFSDPMHDHHGGIYKAANFTHDGMTGRETHNKNEAGDVIHRRIPYQHKRRMGYPDGVEGMARARKDLKLVKFTTPAKHRWLLKIGKNRRARAANIEGREKHNPIKTQQRKPL